MEESSNSQTKSENVPKAIPFITYSPSEGFSLTQESESFLGSLSKERKIGIVSIVGKYRTGKSFFVNRVLLNSQKTGFKVGSTVNACTKVLFFLSLLTNLSLMNPGSVALDPASQSRRRGGLRHGRSRYRHRGFRRHRRERESRQ